MAEEVPNIIPSSIRSECDAEADSIFHCAYIVKKQPAGRNEPHRVANIKEGRRLWNFGSLSSLGIGDLELPRLRDSGI